VSFLIDGPWLYGTGRAYARAEPRTAAALGAATIAGFWAVSVSLYLNRPWTRPIWEACRAQDGRDWMINSGVLSIDHERAGPRTHAIAAALFAGYPLCLWLGYKHASK
jgi:hypothetical protein